MRSRRPRLRASFVGASAARRPAAVWYPRRLVVAFAASALVASTPACRRDAATEANGAQFVCACTYLTDYDDAAHLDVDVCVAHGKDPVAMGSRCAAESAHNPVETCTCGVAGPACRTDAAGACRIR